MSVLQTGIYICSDNSGYLRYANRYTGQLAGRPLPPHMASFVADRKRVYENALHAIAPDVVPVAIENNYRPGFQMTTAKVVLIVVLILIVLGLISTALEK